MAGQQGPCVPSGSSSDQLFAVRLPPSILVQVPDGRYNHEAGSLAFVLSPAQECVAVPQSFAPAAAIPKHFSEEKVGTGAGPLAADAKFGVATAAMIAEAISRFIFIAEPF